VTELANKGALIEDLYEVLSECTTLELDTTVFEILFDGEAVLQEVAQWGASDTVVREQGMNVLINKLIGMDWPTYGDGATAEEIDCLVESMQNAHDKLMTAVLS